MMTSVICDGLKSKPRVLPSVQKPVQLGNAELRPWTTCDVISVKFVLLVRSQFNYLLCAVYILNSLRFHNSYRMNALRMELYHFRSIIFSVIVYVRLLSEGVCLFFIHIPNIFALVSY